jgi:DNA-binding transcriptional MerR regulator
MNPPDWDTVGAKVRSTAPVAGHPLQNAARNAPSPKAWIVVLSKQMRISELTRRTGVTVATIKYYIREGLMRPGTAISATQAEYDASHVDRLRLIRALVDVGNLSITTVGRLLATLDEAENANVRENTPREVEAETESETADPALAATAVAAAHAALSPPASPGAAEPVRARAAMAAVGWEAAPGSAALRQLETALTALEAVHLPPSEATLRSYAAAALAMAEADVNSTPSGSAAEVVRYVVVGTVMYEPVLIALRRLAQHHVFAELSSRTHR